MTVKDTVSCHYFPKCSGNDYSIFMIIIKLIYQNTNYGSLHKLNVKWTQHRIKEILLV
jgi:hypothetical protein